MKRFRLLPNPMLTLLLAGIWLLLNNTLAGGHVVLGLFLGWAIPLLVSGFLIEVPRVRKPLKLCRFILIVLCDIVAANIQVARLVLGPKEKLRPAFIVMPMRIENEFVLAVLTSIVSLTPGTVSAGLSPDHKSLLMHALDAPDREEIVTSVQNRYEAALLEIFEC